MKSKIYLAIIILAALLTSCLTDKMISRNCDRFASVCGSDVQTAYKDTTITIEQDITVPIAPDSVVYAGRVKVVNGLAELAPVTLRGNLIAADLSIRKGELFYKAYTYKTELPVRLYAQITLPGAIRESARTTLVEKSVIPKAYRWAFWIVLTELAIGAIWLAGKLNVLTLIKNLLKRI